MVLVPSPAAASAAAAAGTTAAARAPAARTRPRACAGAAAPQGPPQARLRSLYRAPPRWRRRRRRTNISLRRPNVVLLLLLLLLRLSETRSGPEGGEGRREEGEPESESLFMEGHPFIETSPKDPQELRRLLLTLKIIVPKQGHETEQQRRASLSKLKFHQNVQLGNKPRTLAVKTCFWSCKFRCLQGPQKYFKCQRQSRKSENTMHIKKSRPPTIHPFGDGCY
ncbi:uncharacterized protein LOC135273575 [Aotus nancymaae]|uniref:uncharacterized protein LOC135273575 n=1 Tax=Aotus nancymaae TaxID=37293 RepID=UPI0030FF326E